MWYLLFLRFRVLYRLNITDQLMLLILNLRLFPRFWPIGLLLWLPEIFLLINMGLCMADRFRIVLVLLLKLLTCFLKRFTKVKWLTKLIFTKSLTLSWKFLLLVLSCFDFHPSFVGWISTVLRSTMLSIKINGSLVGFFFLVVEVLDKVILCLLYVSISQRKFLVEVSQSL